jgi:hypothetical protein
MAIRSLLSRSPLVVSILAFTFAALSLSCAPGEGTAPARFAVTFPEELSAEPLDGRLVLMLSTAAEGEPRFQISDGPATQLAFGAARTLGLPRFGGVLQGLELQLLALLLVGSYVVGHLFYRQDPKGPDQASSRRIWKRSLKHFKRTLESTAKGAEGGRDGVGPPVAQLSDDEVQERMIQSEAFAIRPDDKGEMDVQFPYLYLKEYLEHRKLDHLAALVPWRGEVGETHHKRTKMFLNLLKIRLQYVAPERCAAIARNEAHVRLTSSVWYITRMLAQLAGIGILLALVPISFRLLGGIEPLAFELAAYLMWNVLVLLGCLWAKVTIERFFHYQRVREIVYVLETAHFAFQQGENILDNIGVQVERYPPERDTSMA